MTHAEVKQWLVDSDYCEPDDDDALMQVIEACEAERDGYMRAAYLELSHDWEVYFDLAEFLHNLTIED